MAAIPTLLSVLIVSIASLAGIALLGLRERTLRLVLLELVAFSVGALLGDVFLHIFPEIAESVGFSLGISIAVLVGILFGFATEKFIHWHHCHGNEEHCHDAHDHHHHAKPYATLNIIGDGVHNFIDGIIIAAAYLASLPVGLATTVAVLLHEIPQELGDYAVLIHAGWSRAKALGMNLLTALTAIVGAVLTLLLGPSVEGLVPFLLAFAAGTFLYLATTDLIPELHKETRVARSAAQFVAILAGIAVMGLLLVTG